jgi:hypothetical protein
MDIDTAANPADVVDTQAPAAPANDTTEATTQAEGTTATTDTTADVDDFGGLLSHEVGEEEVEYEGAKYKVPAPLKDALLRQADYTQKTMTLAEERRAVEAQRSQILEAQQLSRAEINAFSELNVLNTQLADFEGVDWTQLDHSDPQVQHAKGVRDELARKHQVLSAQINQHLTAKQARAQQETAKEREATDAAMSKIVKDWNPEKRSQFEAFAVSQGIPAEYAGQAGPAEMKIIRLAMIGAQAEQQRVAALKAAANAKTQPAPELGAGAGSGTSDPDAMTPAQYRAWRARQEQG